MLELYHKIRICKVVPGVDSSFAKAAADATFRDLLQHL